MGYTMKGLGGLCDALRKKSGSRQTSHCDGCFYFKVFIAHLGRKLALIRNIRYNCVKELFDDEVEQIQQWAKVCNHFFTL